MQAPLSLRVAISGITCRDWWRCCNLAHLICSFVFLMLRLPPHASLQSCPWQVLYSGAVLCFLIHFRRFLFAASCFPHYWFLLPLCPWSTLIRQRFPLASCLYRAHLFTYLTPSLHHLAMPCISSLLYRTPAACSCCTLDLPCRTAFGAKSRRRLYLLYHASLTHLMACKAPAAQAHNKYDQ